MSNARIIEIFSSIQGEGLWVGKPQVFVRFHGCKLHCTYCDTPLTHHKIKESRIEFPPYSKNFEKHPLEWGAEELSTQIARFEIPSLALTGGEPLEQIDFIEPWLNQLNGKYEILLETSGVEVEALKKVISKIDMVSLDIKLPSSSGERPLWETHEKFLAVAKERPHYAKVVFDEKMTEEEKQNLIKILQKNPGLIMIFQPVSPLQKRDMKSCLDIFSFFSNRFPKQARLLPQMHKFLAVL
ncbi:MAG TPA: hypothetical protein DDW49_02040 [Deltaproteobacteria bacterium]|nr:MAG: hypothetical protein A2048_10000 [Deltaproteobacteria bacterium GWA2_45_12]HBF12165.1 hypothetical protein [Deltaproteobacteria bacterium]